MLSPASVDYKPKNNYLNRLESIQASIGKEGAHTLVGNHTTKVAKKIQFNE